MSFFTFPLFAHHFKPSQYGMLDLLTLAGMLVGWTVAVEIYQAVGRFVAGERDAQKARLYSSTALWFSAGAYVAFALIVVAAAQPIAHAFLGGTTHTGLLRVAVVWMCLGGFLAIPQ